MSARTHTTEAAMSKKPLRDQITAYLSTVEDATATQITMHTSERDYPSRVLRELNAMRTDALVECGKKGKGRDLSYWLAHNAAEAASTTPAGIPIKTPEGAEKRRQIIRNAIAGKTPSNGPAVKDLAAACGVTGQYVEQLLVPMLRAGTVGKVRNDGERFHRVFDPSTAPTTGDAADSDGGVTDVRVAVTTDRKGDEVDSPVAAKPDFARDPELQYLAPEDYEMPPADPALLAMANRHLSEQVSMYKEICARYDINDCPAGLAGHLSRMNDVHDELRASIAQSAQWLDSIREHLSPFPVGIDPSSMTEVELAESAANAIRDGLERIFSRSSADEASSELANARALSTKLQTLLDSKTHECEALRAELERTQQEGEQAVDVKDAARGYLVKAPKRKLRILTKPESAHAVAMAAARNGSGRGDVYALVYIGSARRGAEWKAA